MKGTENAYEGENRSLHMKERIGYGVGDFANNMMYNQSTSSSPISSQMLQDLAQVWLEPFFWSPVSWTASAT